MTGFKERVPGGRRKVTRNPFQTLRSAVDSFRLAPGESLFHQGDPGDRMYVLLEGTLDILIGQRIVESLGEGGIVGEMAMIDQSPRAASAIAKTPCRLVGVDRNRFHLLVESDPSFSTHVMKVMADRLRHMNQLFMTEQRG